jgi:hypothetical protein
MMLCTAAKRNKTSFSINCKINAQFKRHIYSYFRLKYAKVRKPGISFVFKPLIMK